jgi:hypothetical protein
MVMVIILAAVELTLASLVYYKLGSQSQAAHPKKLSHESHPDPTQTRKDRTYSDNLHTSYIDAVNDEEKNPFVNDNMYLSTGQRVKISLMTVTVLPVRILLSTIILLLAAVYGKLATVGMPPTAGLKSPISKFRAVLAQPIRLFLRSLLFVWGFHWIHVKGKRASARDAPVIVPNHITFIEPLALVALNMPMSVGAYATM